MRQYIRKRTELLDKGVTIEEVTDHIAGGIAALAEADDALVVLEWYESVFRARFQALRRGFCTV